MKPAVLQAATRPTFYFIGVTTAASSIMKVFPAWARHLGLQAEIRGIDFPLHAPADDYRAAVQFLKDDPLSLGALVTTHKIDLFAACRELFDVVDPHALRLGETSCLSKRNRRGASGERSNLLICHAKDPITAGLAIDNFVPAGHFARTGAEVFAIGAGGSTLAISWHLTQALPPAQRPKRLIVSDRSEERLEEIRRIHASWSSDTVCEYLLAPTAAANDKVLSCLSPGALVINATGLGKDSPGSPLSAAAVFPPRAIAWDLNYRGDLVFLQQARAQAAERQLQVEDGWIYFIFGWTRVMAEVFDIDIPTHGPGLAELSRIADEAGKPAPFPQPVI